MSLPLSINTYINNVAHFAIKQTKLFIIAINIIHTLILVAGCVKSKDASEPFILDVDDNPM